MIGAVDRYWEATKTIGLGLARLQATYQQPEQKTFDDELETGIFTVHYNADRRSAVLSRDKQGLLT